MKNTIQINRSKKGFTLIELIITIVIVAILGTFLVTFMTSVPKSVTPVIQTQNLAAAQAVMEKITADYERYLRGGIGAPIWDLIGAEATTKIDSMPSTITYSDSTIPNMPDFTEKKVTVTAGDQTLVSYFIIK
jgi:prepilin-type N-terminal cleavage/methylation domain-containing protein